MRHEAKPTRAMSETAHATGVTTAISAPMTGLTAQLRIDDGRTGVISTGNRPASSCGRKKTTNPMAATAAWFETTTEAASTTATMNVIDAVAPIAAKTRAS